MLYTVVTITDAQNKNLNRQKNYYPYFQSPLNHRSSRPSLIAAKQRFKSLLHSSSDRLIQRSRLRFSSRKLNAISSAKLYPLYRIPELSSYKQRIREFLYSYRCTIMLLVITIYSLFADDVRELLLPLSWDVPLSIVSVACIAVFLGEVILASLSNVSYFNSFYFWLDILSTFSILFDIVWLQNYINYGQSAANIAQIARAGRISKIGARSARFMRIFKILRRFNYFNCCSNSYVEPPKDGLKIRENGHHLNGIFEVYVKDHSRKSEKGLSLAKSQKGLTLIGDIDDRSDKNHELHEDSAYIIFKESDNKYDIRNPKNSNFPVVIYGPCYNKIAATSVRYKKLHDVIRPDNSNYEQLDSVIYDTEKHSYSSNQYGNDAVLNTVVPDIAPAPETKVGYKLKGYLSKNIIILIFLVLLSVPLFTTSTWANAPTITDRAFLSLKFCQSASTSQSTIYQTISVFIDYNLKLSTPLVYFQFKSDDGSVYTFPDDYPQYSYVIRDQIRDADLLYVQKDDITIVYDLSRIYRLNSGLNIMRTVFVCVLILLSTLAFAHDVYMIAFEPLYQMLDSVNNIAKNPIQAIQILEIQYTEYRQLITRSKTEPVVLENMIVKIASLLVVGLGYAGAAIISKNILNEGAVNAMIPGYKIMAIFAFCDIRGFAYINDALETSTLDFVNYVAYIVQGVVSRHGGSTNKNIGDAFLLVWKFDEKETIRYEHNNTSQVSLRKIIKVRQKADLAVHCAIKVLIDVYVSSKVRKYKKSEALIKKLEESHGDVSMGFGLHVGWAIEGAIGSSFKIDASYLSPHVNISSRLEAASRQYNTNILLSGELYNLMSTNNQKFIRKLDRIAVKGSNTPLEIYTIDLIISRLSNSKDSRVPISILKEADRKRLRIKNNTMRKVLCERLDSNKDVTKSLFYKDNNLAIIRYGIPNYFTEIWHSGVERYLYGNWEEALKQISLAQSFCPLEMQGPGRNLLSFIKANIEKIAYWKGFRQLHYK